ncbi:hypothetical protein GGR54DRAFT_629212 [Hypoxylon sp. NC1633]|nr:hypothetical protein GGR54DRAFT_629212 [Hypoxylon sp. NC1633]
MNGLPLELEIRAKIASFIPKRSTTSSDGEQTTLARSSIASLSRAWQATTEPVTFRCLRVKSNELGEFTAMFKTIHRRKYLRTLTFEVVLPTYSDELCAEFETDQDRKAHDKIASEAVSLLLRELATWSAELNIHSTSIFTRQWITSIADLFENRHRYSYIHFAHFGDLQVPCIRSLPSPTYRHLSPDSLASLTARFPALSEIRWIFFEPGVFSALRKQLRHDFTTSLQKLKVSPEIKRLDILVHPPWYFPHQRLPNIVGSLPNDPLCAALRNMIRRSSLRDLKYTGPIDPSFFWPSDPNELCTTWASIETVTVSFDHTSPSGKWYFEDDEFNDPTSNEPLPANTPEHYPPGYGTEADSKAALAFDRSMSLERNKDTLYRYLPSDEVMMPLLEAFARRLESTPSLRYASLETELDHRDGLLGDRDYSWFVSYYAPGKSCEFDECMDEPDAGLSQARIFFHTYDWRPERRLINLFRTVGKITFLPSLC